MSFLETLAHMFGAPLKVEARKGFLLGLWTDSVEDAGDFIKIHRFPYKWFAKRVKSLYGTHRIEKIYELMGMSFFGKQTIKIHKFFIPELIYVLSKASSSGAVKSLIDELIKKTWVADIHAEEDPPSDTDMSRIDKDMKVELFNWQKEFIELYDIKRKRSHLNGELLSFGCGLGKTITSLATMKSVGCDCVIVIAPKSTLKDVWCDHIERFYKKKQEVYLIGRDSPKDADFYIFNYESMDKIDDVMKFIKKKHKLGIIVDESHNFLKIKSNRTQNLIKLRNDTGCQHILMQSGTPIKAVGIEIVPILRVIDGFFDEFAQDVFLKAFGTNTNIATDILNARLNLIMHRRKMEEVFTLPEKKLDMINLKIDKGNDYTIQNVKQRLIEYTEARIKYHKEKMPTYQKWWDESIKFFIYSKVGGTAEFKRYYEHTKWLIKNGYDHSNRKCVEDTVWANKYEKEVLIPLFTSRTDKEHFIECKSKIKYLPLCIQGEVLGKLENIRGEMTAKMMNTLDIEDIVESSLKKVIFFTTYVDTVVTLKDRCEKLGYNPVLVYGETSKNVQPILDKFRKDKSVRVLIATMQTLATGVTLTEANTVVFCNLPYRSADREQAENRVWRIGQDTECVILTVRLDTGSKLNLSDRTAEIHDWSKTMTEMIVDGNVTAIDMSEGTAVVKGVDSVSTESLIDKFFSL